MSEFLIEKEITNKQRSKAKRCPKCRGYLIRFGGAEWKSSGTAVSFVVGRVCKRCEVFYINPRYEHFKIIYDKIGEKTNKIEIIEDNI